MKKNRCDFVKDKLLNPESSLHICEKKYFVFISYARQDKLVAHEIQKFLENYKYPVDLISSERRPDDSKFLRPVFVDTTDLSTLDSSYKNGLRDAIINSNYMVVLCSKSSARTESVCHWEITTFLQNHSSDCILPIALEGTDDDSIPSELHSIRNLRNIVLWNPLKRLSRSSENKSNIFKVIEFLLGIDAMRLHNRYQVAENRKKKLIFALTTCVLLIITVLSLYAVKQSHMATVKERERAKSESARANFEKKVFPYSLVYSYKENFLKPLLDNGKGKKTIIVIAMPQNYSELSNSAFKRKTAMAKDAINYGWNLKPKSIAIPGWIRPLETDELIFNNIESKKICLYADMATTTKSIKAVVDYLIKDSPYYSPSQRDALTAQYINEFQICVLELFRKEIQRGVLEIYFVKEKESLRIALMSIEKNLR